MALPTSVTTVDAGTTLDRLTYTLSSGVDANGNHYYQSGSKYIFYATAPYGSGTPQWCLGGTLNASGPGQFDYYTSGTVATVTNLPLTGWIIGGGASPAPTFTINPKVPSGGAAVSVPIYTGHNGLSTGGAGSSSFVILDPSGAVFANSSSIPSSSPAANTVYTAAGSTGAGAAAGTWTITTGSSASAPVLVQAPAGLTISTGWDILLNNGIYSSGGYYGPFDVVAANPQLPIGTQTTIPPTGTDAPTSLNYPSYIANYSGWELADPTGTVIAWSHRYTSTGNPTSSNTNGWATANFPYTVSSVDGHWTITSFPLTPPAGTPIATGYEIRAVPGSGPAASAYFDVTPAVVMVPGPTNMTVSIVY